MTAGGDLLYPLSEFYLRSELTLPAVARIDGQLVPEPYKSLLVHNADMTLTLEKYHDQRMNLHVLKRHLQGDRYSRQVLLVCEKDKKPAEFGAIRIHLQHFPREARLKILEGRLPLGAILNDQKVPHTSHPVAFVQITPDAIIRRALGLRDTHMVFGRRNTLIGSSEQILADILEVLPTN